MPVGSGAREAEEAEVKEEEEALLVHCLSNSSEPSLSRGAQVDATADSRAPIARSEASKFSVSSPGRWNSARPSMRADSTGDERGERREEKEEVLNVRKRKKQTAAIEIEENVCSLLFLSRPLKLNLYLSAERDTWPKPGPGVAARGRRTGGALCEASRRLPFDREREREK